MTEFAVIMLATILVNNFVLVQFLGLCPFMGVSGKLETAMGMSMATTFVLTLASVVEREAVHPEEKPEVAAANSLAFS